MIVLRLLHISDIHFRTPYCLDPDHDRDGPIRDTLARDLSSIVEKDQQPISAILITGDIAYKADPEEFEMAASWLHDLCIKSRCSPQNVFVVPGNHDVNQSTCRDRMIGAVRGQVLAKNGEARQRDFHDALSDSQSGAQLIKPMEAYNKFAARYGCEISPQRPNWTHELEIAPGTNLILNGLTSTFFSDENDKLGTLFLGGIQTTFRKKDGAIHLAMMHHPPEWLQDCDDVNDALNDRASIHLVGHKHRGRWTPGLDNLRVSAHAFHPNRAEGAYEPGYNVLDLTLESNRSGTHHVSVDGHIRVLQNSPEIFRAKINGQGMEVFNQKIPVTISSKHPTPTPKATEDKVSADKPPSETTMPNEKQEIDAREIVYKFWQLKASQRMTIVNELKLVTNEQLKLPETELYRIAFETAKKKGVTVSLIQKIISAEKNNER